MDEAGAAAPLPGEELPSFYPSRCSNEIGAGDGADASTRCPHKPGGLWETATWPLKYFDTCTKQQGRRGTCLAFAITAGREIRVAQRYGRWVNRSEQHLHYVAKRRLFPAEYGDGLSASLLLARLHDEDYRQPLEQDWDYNPSRSRIENSAARTYSNSCVGYGGAEQAFCSDTTHQGRIVCGQWGGVQLCAVIAPPLGPTTVRSVDAPAELWDPKDPEHGLRNVIVALLNHQPVVILLQVTESFDSPDENGFVRFRPSQAKLCPGARGDAKCNEVGEGDCECKKADDCECSRGGHAVLAVGFIPATKLPADTPDSTGGFLIVKNSWGCAGDGGYWYLPASWVRSFTRSVRPVGTVEVLGPLPDQPIDDFRFDFRPVPPSIRIVQPAPGETYVEGQGIPMTVEGADYQNRGYVLTGPVVWTSSLQGQFGTGQSIIATLSEGVHVLRATYTGTSGVATAVRAVRVGPRPPNLPPTAVFEDYWRVNPTNPFCRDRCPSWADTCILGFGYGTDPEDGELRGGSSVRWYIQYPRSSSPDLSSTGASFRRILPAFIGCFRACGGTYRFILEVEDSSGQRAEARRELDTPGCDN